MAPPLKLPPGATLVEDSSEMKLPPGASLVTEDSPTQPTTKPSPPAEDWRDKYTKITPHNLKSLLPGKNGQFDPKAYLHEGGTALSNVGAGGLGVILHPVDTAGGILRSAVTMSPAGGLYQDVRHLMDPNYKTDAETMANQIVEHPLETAEQFAGQTAALDAGGEVVGRGTRALKETSRKMREGVTGTSPRVTKELAAKTAEENTKNATRTDKLNAKRAEVDTARAGKVEKSNADALKEHDTAIAEADKKNLAEHVKHLAEKSQIERANQEAGAVPRADEATGEHLKARTEEMDVRTEKAAHDSLEKADAMFKPLREKLGPFDADPEKINGAVSEAVEKVGIAHPATSLLKDLVQRIKGQTIGKELNIPTEGETAYKNPNFSFADEQAFYSRLGRELSSGTLPGDIYNAYKDLQTKIGEDMQRIADAQGKGKELAAAREYWKRQRQAFGKSSDADTSRADKEITQDNPDYSKEQVRDFRRRLLGFFDPEIPKLAAEIDEANAKLKAPASEKVKPVPEAPKPVEVNPPDTKPVPKPRPPLETPVKKVELEDIRQAKGESAAKKENKARTGYAPIVSTGLFVDALRSAMQGQWEHAGVDVAARGLYEIGKQTYAALLRNPDVMRVITEPTARDIAQIPPELRGESLKGLIEQAKKQGIKVDPRISALAGASAVGPRTQELQKMRSQPSQ
jgi:hypothetical protein